ncbi:MAG: VOC family protein, partial [Candidatus Saccharimonadales bacterium]
GVVPRRVTIGDRARTGCAQPPTTKHRPPTTNHPTPTTPMPAELYCIELHTARWQELVEWYKRVVGMRSALRIPEDRYALLVGGGGRLAIVGSDRPEPASDRCTLAFEVADLDVAEARLEAAGVEIGPRRLHPEGFTTIAAHDPDGNRVRLFAWPIRR